MVLLIQYFFHRRIRLLLHIDHNATITAVNPCPTKGTHPCMLIQHTLFIYRYGDGDVLKNARFCVTQSIEKRMTNSITNYIKVHSMFKRYGHLNWSSGPWYKGATTWHRECICLCAYEWFLKETEKKTWQRYGEKQL